MSGEEEIVDAKREIDRYHSAAAKAAQHVTDEIKGIYERASHEMIDNLRAMDAQVVVLTKNIKELQKQFDEINNRNDQVIGIIQQAHQDTAERAYQKLVDEHNVEIEEMNTKFEEFITRIDNASISLLSMFKKAIATLTAESLPTTQVKIQYFTLGVIGCLIGMGIYSVFA